MGDDNNVQIIDEDQNIDATKIKLKSREQNGYNSSSKNITQNRVHDLNESIQNKVIQIDYKDIDNKLQTNNSEDDLDGN